MRGIDVLKAAGLAVAVLAANLLLTVAAVFAWSQAFARGRDPAFYNALAMKIGAWSGPIGGTLLMALVGYAFGRRVPARNAHLFAGVVFGVYAVVDAAAGLAMASAAKVFTLQFLASLSVTALGGQVGAALSRRRPA